MNSLLTQKQIQSYQRDGFLLVEDFLDQEELSKWQQAIAEAIKQRGGRKMPGSDAKTGEEDGINIHSDYFGKELKHERKRSIWEQHITCSQIRNSESYTVII